MPLSSDIAGDTLTLRLSGDWSIDSILEIESALAPIVPPGIRQVRVDCARLDRLDLSAAWLLRTSLNTLEKQGATIHFTGPRPPNLEFVEDMTRDSTTISPPHLHTEEPLTAAVAAVGKLSVVYTERARSALDFYGRVLMTFASALRHPKRLRIASNVRHVYETGLQAVPIVALIAFLITLVIAYIGAQQLERFGAEIFTVDLVTVGVLREMGVLLTAIIVAGRSGSAFAAELGVMQLNDEVDALKSIGIDPIEVLVLPRVLGLIIA
jgi:phospholipid/cholesterol/gamma-HCH transport system permease protein